MFTFLNLFIDNFVCIKNVTIPLDDELVMIFMKSVII